MSRDGSLGALGQSASGPDRPPRKGQPGVKSDSRPRAGRRARHGIEAAKGKYSGSAVEDLWHRLDALDFMNQAMILAGTLLLCVFPFLIVLSALTGRGAASSFSRRLGLNHQAAADLGHLFTSSGATSATITTASCILLVLFALAGANAVQQVYERIFELESRGVRDMLRRIIWAGLVVGWLFLGDLVGPWARAGGPVWAASRFPDRHLLSYFMLPPDWSGTGPAPLAGSGIQVLSGDGSDYSGSRCTVQCPPALSAVSGT